MWTSFKQNEIFKTVIQQGKVERRGETCAKIPISDPDTSKLSSYILENMKEPFPPPPMLRNSTSLCFLTLSTMGGIMEENLRGMRK